MQGGQRLQQAGRCAPEARPTRRITWAHSVAQAEAALSETYNRASVEAPSSLQHMRMRLEVIALPQLVISDLELTTAFMRGERHPWFALFMPIQGEMRVASDRATRIVAGRNGAVLAPDEPVTAEVTSGHGRIKCVMIEKNALQDELAMMLGRALDRPLHFDFEIDNATSGAALRRSLDMFISELSEPDGPLATPATAEQLGRLVMAGLLVSYRHNYSDELAAPAGTRSPRAIREAVLAIENDPTRFNRVVQIAAASGLSVRALDEGFRRHLGVSPMRYLRQVRLARAHAALLAADADQTTATAVAHAWGFLHYGRFAAEYRKAYGRSPSEVLRSG